jgi:hypothetical protein
MGALNDWKSLKKYFPYNTPIPSELPCFVTAQEEYRGNGTIE